MSEQLFTSIRIFLSKGKGKTLASVSVKIADVFFITGLRVCEGTKGPFVSMPSRKASNGEYKDICFPADKITRDLLSDLVLGAYREAVLKEGKP